MMEVAEVALVTLRMQDPGGFFLEAMPCVITVMDSASVSTVQQVDFLSQQI